MRDYRIRITFQEEVLGTASSDKEIYRSFIASKAPDASTVEDEIAAVGVNEVLEKSMTVFPKDEIGTPCLYDYQIRGFFKGSCGDLRRTPGTESSKIKAYKKEVDGNIFVFPRVIRLNCSGKVGFCERPLRTCGVQGERVALASSESVPAGTTAEFTVRLLNDKAHEDALFEWLSYGWLKGIGQWRNSGKGKFTYEILDEKSVSSLTTPPLGEKYNEKVKVEEKATRRI